MRGTQASAPMQAHVTTTKEAPGRRRAGSSLSCGHQKVAQPSTSPAEPSPGHGPLAQPGVLRRVDDKDAG